MYPRFSGNLQPKQLSGSDSTESAGPTAGGLWMSVQHQINMGREICFPKGEMCAGLDETNPWVWLSDLQK